MKSIEYSISFICLIFIILNLNILNLMSQNNTIGYFENHLDIGKVKIPGTVTYNDQDKEYLIEGSGTNIWFGNDEFHFLFKKLFPWIFFF